MSKRKMKGTGWVNPKKHPKGPNGRGLCRMCGIEVPQGRRTFCSEPCIHQYRLRNDSRYASTHLYKRDRGVCSMCGVDTYKIRREFHTKIKEVGWFSEEGKALQKEYKDAGWAPLDMARWYNTDHILPVAEGGGPQDYPIGEDYEKNLRTLCKICHKKETRELRKRLKENKDVR